ncbi:Pentatricopeptide repeat-containing protein, mitochondrial [Glycine soja]|uniref:Pentatricopeptide repeat-containing protein, mitochondrial n=1 Tax=Glycine soja TaxID=3848 RepID=A0A445IZ29_GLYSO|nr:Pentatricopeptide repeat-containing protein, mitochondrial [Glycine soja]
MCLLGVKSNEFTFPSVLKACSMKRDLNMGRKVHGMAVVIGFESDGFVVNILVVMYAKCCLLADSRRLFGGIVEQNVVSWNAMFSCYVQSESCGEAVGSFKEMVRSGIGPNEFSISIILNACASYWLIAGCVLHNRNDLALMLLDEMKGSGTHPNMFTLSSALKACATMGFKELGRQLHSSLIKMDADSDLFAAVGVVHIGIVSWSAMIGGYAQHGHGKEALQLFNQMLRDGVTQPYYFGKLNEAVELVNSIPFEADGSVWGALLGAARIHKNIELGQKAAEMLFDLEPEKSGTHVLLANIYASAGIWENVAKVRKLMKDNKVKKEPGMSWNEIKD